MNIELRELIDAIGGQPTEKPSVSLLDPIGMLCIVIADRGHVWVGRVSVRDHEWLWLDRAASVRRWGTKTGLGQLAACGPQPETVLDEIPEGVHVLRRAVIAVLPCKGLSWSAR